MPLVGARSPAVARGALARSRRRAREGGAGVDGADASRPSSTIAWARCARASSSISTGRCWRYRDALIRDPAHAATRAGLEKLLASPSHAEAALEVLEPLYENDQNWEKVVQLAEVRLGITSGHPEQAALLETIAERCEKELGDPSRALDAHGAGAPAASRRAAAGRRGRAARRGGRQSARARPTRSSRRSTAAASSATRRAISACARRGCGTSSARPIAPRHATSTCSRSTATTATRSRRSIASIARAARTPSWPSILARRAGIEYDVGEKKRLYAEAAELHERALATCRRAIAGWRKVLDADDGDVRGARQPGAAARARGALARAGDAARAEGARRGGRGRAGGPQVAHRGHLGGEDRRSRPRRRRLPRSARPRARLARGARRARGAGAAARRLHGGAGGAGAPAPGRRRRARSRSPSTRSWSSSPSTSTSRPTTRSATCTRS